MKNVGFVVLIIIAAVIIISSFFMPWARLSTSVTKISEKLTAPATGTLKEAPLAGKFIKELEKITSALGDVEVKATVSGYNIPTLVNKKSSKVAISLAQTLFKGGKDLDKKSMLVFLVPLFAGLCVVLAIVGVKYKLSVVLMLLLSGAISVGGLYNLKTTDFSNLLVKITIEKGLWQTIYAYLFIFLLSIVWLITDKKQANNK